MFLPKLVILPINPEENVKFITNYLSDDKRKNNTRPFYENKAYPQFYVPKPNDSESIMDKVKKCYKCRKNIEEFLNEAYKIVCDYV
ncbi:MAG: hypothetical protein J6J44_07350 [Lachnospiraceae bacterium]|nr:hypothetical protein [Lachnospiraceae bacterium]